MNEHENQKKKDRILPPSGRGETLQQTMDAFQKQYGETFRRLAEWEAKYDVPGVRYNSKMPTVSQAAHTSLKPYVGRGLFITGTGTDVGKTIVTAAIAGALRRLNVRVGVCKPITSGCTPIPRRDTTMKVPLRQEDLQSLDALFSARAAGLEVGNESMLRHVSPMRYATPVAPSVAARIEQRPVEWQNVQASLDWWQKNCEVLLVEGAGGWLVPLDEHDFMIADLAAALRLPVLVVTHASLGAINSTLLTVQAIRQRGVTVAGLVINRVPPAAQRDIATATNLEELPRLSGVPVRGVLPDLGPGGIAADIPEEFVDAMLPFARDWALGTI